MSETFDSVHTIIASRLLHCRIVSKRDTIITAKVCWV